MSVYDPIVAVVTLPDTVTDGVIVPSTISVAMTPMSTYVDHWFTVVGETPRRVITGAVVSMFATFATVDPVFTSLSTNKKVNVPFVEKTYVLLPVLFVIVIDSLAPVRVAVTLPLVVESVEYVTTAVGAVVSTTFTVRVVDPEFHAPSVYLYSNI